MTNTDTGITIIACLLLTSVYLLWSIDSKLGKVIATHSELLTLEKRLCDEVKYLSLKLPEPSKRDRTLADLFDEFRRFQDEWRRRG